MAKMGDDDDCGFMGRLMGARRDLEHETDEDCARKLEHGLRLEDDNRRIAESKLGEETARRFMQEEKDTILAMQYQEEEAKEDRIFQEQRQINRIAEKKDTKIAIKLQQSLHIKTALEEMWHKEARDYQDVLDQKTALKFHGREVNELIKVWKAAEVSIFQATEDSIGVTVELPQLDNVGVSAAPHRKGPNEGILSVDAFADTEKKCHFSVELKFSGIGMFMVSSHNFCKKSQTLSIFVESDDFKNKTEQQLLRRISVSYPNRKRLNMFAYR